MGRLFKIALGLFLIGVGVVAVFSILSEDNLFAFANDEDFVYHELNYDADAFTKLDFDFENRDFIFRPSDDEGITITYYTTEKDPVVVTDAGDTLELVNDIEWYNQIFAGWDFFINDDYYEVLVYLPDSVIYELRLRDSNGSIDIQGLDNFSDIYVVTSNGRIVLEDVFADSMDLTSSNGEIRLTDAAIDNALEIITSNGRINLTNVVAENIDAVTSNGKIIVINIFAEQVELDSSNGDIEANFRGDKSDYEIYMSTSNGDLTYDGLTTTSGHINDGAPYEVHLETSNGDVVVTFGE